MRRFVPAEAPGLLAELHPARLACAALAYGLSPAPARAWRVLELGCGDAARLCNMALGLPQAEFCGADAYADSVLQAQANLAELDLANVRITELTTLQTAPCPAPLDCVLVPDLARLAPFALEDLLRACRAWLAPQGVLAVGHVPRPGGDLLGALDAAAKHAPEPGDALAETAAWLEARCAEDTPAQRRFREQAGFLRAATGGLAMPDNSVYFHQLLDAAAAQGLSYLGDAPADPRQDGPAGPAREQCRDFVEHRLFRVSLWGRADAPRRAGGLRAADLDGLACASAYAPLSEDPGIHLPDLIVRYANPEGHAIAESLPLAKAALCCLAEAWPAYLEFGALHAAARARLQARGTPPEHQGDAARLAACLLEHHAAGAVQLAAAPFPGVAQAGPRPLASPLARLQFRQGRGQVLDLRQRTLELAPIAANLLPYLDGSRDRAALREVLQGWVIQGKIRPQAAQTLSHAELSASLDALLDNLLAGLAQQSLLLA